MALSSKKVRFAPDAKPWDGLGPDEMKDWRVVQAAEYLIKWWFEKCKQKKVLSELSCAEPVDLYLKHSFKLKCFQSTLGHAVALRLSKFIACYFDTVAKHGSEKWSIPITPEGGGVMIKVRYQQLKYMQELQADFQTTQQWKDLDKAARCIQAAFLRRWASSAHAAACKIQEQWQVHKLRRFLKNRYDQRLLLQAKYPKWYVSCQKRVFINVHYAFKEEAKKDYRAQWDPVKKSWYVWKGTALAAMAIARYGKRHVQYRRMFGGR